MTDVLMKNVRKPQLHKCMCALLTKVSVCCCTYATMQRVSLGALLMVAAYDGWQSRQLHIESMKLALQIKNLKLRLLESRS